MCGAPSESCIAFRLSGVMVMVMMVVMAMRGKSRRRDRKQQRGNNNKLLHAKNVARLKIAGG